MISRKSEPADQTAAASGGIYLTLYSKPEEGFAQLWLEQRGFFPLAHMQCVFNAHLLLPWLFSVGSFSGIWNAIWYRTLRPPGICGGYLFSISPGRRPRPWLYWGSLGGYAAYRCPPPLFQFGDSGFLLSSYTCTQLTFFSYHVFGY